MFNYLFNYSKVNTSNIHNISIYTNENTFMYMIWCRDLEVELDYLFGSTNLSICLSVYPPVSVCLSVGPSVRPSVCLFVCPSLCLFICLCIVLSVQVLVPFVYVPVFNTRRLYSTNVPTCTLKPKECNKFTYLDANGECVERCPDGSPTRGFRSDCGYQ